jgi:hypothetical protein
MSCIVSENQPIYQALIDKAASYPADKVAQYKAKAYNKTAEYVASMNESIYDNRGEFYGWWSPPPNSGIGFKTEEFINEFLKKNPRVPKKPVEEPNEFLIGTAKAMDEARKIAAQNAPSITIDQLRTVLGLDNTVQKPVEKPKAALDYYNLMQEWNKPDVYTAENPRRSKRNVGKPVVKYFTEEDEQDEIAEAIEAVCAKKGWKYSDNLVAEFEAWLPTADKYTLEKYDYKSDKYIPRSKAEAAKEWAMYYSTSLQAQQKLLKISKAIIKYCEKNNIEYNPLMGEKFAAWKADPVNKKLISYSYTSYSGGCTCPSCDPTGERKKNAAANAVENSYERSVTYCVKAWFSTLKKTVIL